MPFTYNYEKDDSVFCPIANRVCYEQLCYLCEDAHLYYKGLKDSLFIEFIIFNNLK